METVRGSNPRWSTVRATEPSGHGGFGTWHAERSRKAWPVKRWRVRLSHPPLGRSGMWRAERIASAWRVTPWPVRLRHLPPRRSSSTGPEQRLRTAQVSSSNLECGSSQELPVRGSRDGDAHGDTIPARVHVLGDGLTCGDTANSGRLYSCSSGTTSALIRRRVRLLHWRAPLGAPGSSTTTRGGCGMRCTRWGSRACRTRNFSAA